MRIAVPDFRLDYLSFNFLGLLFFVKTLEEESLLD